jgi:hypothetical protein
MPGSSAPGVDIVELLAGTLGEFKRAAFSGLIAKVIGEAFFHHPNL